MGDAELTRRILSFLIIVGSLVPTCMFLALTISRMQDSFKRFRGSAKVITRRFIRAQLMLFVMAALFAISFQDLVTVGDIVVRQFLFCSAFIFLLEAAGYGFLAWDLWWEGQGVRVGRRWSDTKDPKGE